MAPKMPKTRIKSAKTVAAERGLARQDRQNPRATEVAITQLEQRVSGGAALDGMSKVVVSFYMDNVVADVVQHQRAVLEKFVPADFALVQKLSTRTHADALDDFVKNTEYDLIVVLDIDCVPLSASSVPTLAMRAAQGELVGCVQRANHIDNHGHLYIGAFCMAFTRQLWEKLGRPSFQPTSRGDVGEELTYRCEEIHQPIHMIWPSSVEVALWDLTDKQKFGLNTEYDGSFLHAFGIRESANQRKFVDRCRDIMGTSLPIRTAPLAQVTDVSACVESDKYYWHRYVDKYEQAFTSLGDVSDILEFGVFEGASIRWLGQRFPGSKILGADITAPRPTWPRGSRFDYVQADQSDTSAIRAMLSRFDRRYDLIVDDGSHLPPHQASCLVEAFPFVRPGKLYIIEDIHTCHPDNPDFSHYSPPGAANCLHVLLAMQHLKDCSLPLSPEVAVTLATPGFFSTDDLVYLFENIRGIDFFKRTSLPLRCYRCRSSAFNYKQLRCVCGVDLYAASDSMSALLWKVDS
jgi:hypothetical protein